MSRTTNNIHHRTAPRAKRCEMCGRQLKDAGKRVPGLPGFYGPECASKLAAYEQVMRAEGLGHFLESSILRFAAIEGNDEEGGVRYSTPPEITRMRRRAEHLGLRVRFDQLEGDLWQMVVTPPASTPKLRRWLKRVGQMEVLA